MSLKTSILCISDLMFVFVLHLPGIVHFTAATMTCGIVVGHRSCTSVLVPDIIMYKFYEALYSVHELL